MLQYQIKYWVDFVLHVKALVHFFLPINSNDLLLFLCEKRERENKNIIDK